MADGPALKMTGSRVVSFSRVASNPFRPDDCRGMCQVGKYPIRTDLALPPPMPSLSELPEPAGVNALRAAMTATPPHQQVSFGSRMVHADILKVINPANNTLSS